MNRNGLIRRVLNELRVREYRKHITPLKCVFTISDSDGNSKDFTVRSGEKDLLLNKSDVAAVIDALVDVAVAAIAEGEPIVIHGFGGLGLKYRQPRASKIPNSDVWCAVKGRWVPKFTFGTALLDAAHRYDMEMQRRQEQGEEIDEPDPDLECDGE